jgi:hypothetical protein
LLSDVNNNENESISLEFSKFYNNILYSRNQFQKHKLKKYYLEGKLSSFDNNLTETQNMFNNNYRKIYDYGNMIFFKIY